MAKKEILTGVDIENNKVSIGDRVCFRSSCFFSIGEVIRFTPRKVQIRSTISKYISTVFQEETFLIKNDHKELKDFLKFVLSLSYKPTDDQLDDVINEYKKNKK